ncbi:MAG: Tellurite methyltransferase [Firmicutes bacterium ADurb.Bin419]|nr:MAG: Tellurite methyltransferase [Firmicutes bacterium ADurb.Bin419]
MSIEFYNRNAEQFFVDTLNADMSAICDKFLKYIRHGGRILDAGCGSGRDSLYFLKQGYEVVSIDASEEMVKMSSQLTGQKTLKMRFDEMDFDSEFDGIWACASLLHVPKADIKEVMYKIVKSLKKEGALFASFKYGNNEIISADRLFNSYDEDGLQDLLRAFEQLQLIEIWKTQDVRPGRENEFWVNCICKKR